MFRVAVFCLLSVGCVEPKAAKDNNDGAWGEDTEDPADPFAADSDGGASTDGDVDESDDDDGDADGLGDDGFGADDDGGDSDGGDSDGGDGDTGESDGVLPTLTTIYDIQTGAFDEGSAVSIEDVVVTTQIIEGDRRAFFVQTREGGAYNGLYIYMQADVEYTPAIGDLVNIAGEYVEYYGQSQIKVTEPEGIEQLEGVAEVVVTDITEEPDDWEVYEGVVLRFLDVEVTDASKLYEWGAVQLAIGCWLENDFTDYDAEDGARYESITGPLSYAFEKYSILPRSTDDLVGYTPPTRTVFEVQSGAFEDGYPVTLNGVVSTSRPLESDNGFFVQDVGGGPWAGVYVYVHEEARSAMMDVAPGAVVNLSGTMLEYYGLTEVVIWSVDGITLTGEFSPPTVDAVAADTEDWEPWEGCLVVTDEVVVTADTDAYGWTALDTDLSLGAGFFPSIITSGTAYTSVPGLISYYHEAFRLLPRTSADFEHAPSTP